VNYGTLLVCVAELWQNEVKHLPRHSCSCICFRDRLHSCSAL